MFPLAAAQSLQAICNFLLMGFARLSRYYSPVIHSLEIETAVGAKVDSSSR